MDKQLGADVAPDWCTRALMIGWLVLLGGRWIATPFILFGDPTFADTVSSLDRGLFLRCYLVLLLLTLLIQALRFAKWFEQRLAARKPRKRAQIIESN